MKLQLKGTAVRLLPGKSQTNHGLYIPERHTRTSVCQIVDAGPDCKQVFKKGARVLVPLNFSERTYQVMDNETGEFLCDESKIFAVVIRNNIYPVGKKILIERLTDEDKFGNIIIPGAQKSTDQSLNGIVTRFGLGHGESFNVTGIPMGTKVRLRKWEAHMVECGWVGKFYIIVNEEDLVCSF